jgi:hypothetical protein
VVAKTGKVDCKKEHTPCRIKKEGSQKYIARVQNSQKSKQKKRRKKVATSHDIVFLYCHA